MSLITSRHLVDGVSYVPAGRGNSSWGEIIPKFLVMHFTAHHKASSAINWFKNSDSRVSCHFVLDRDGTLTQMLPCNVKGWHVGPSYWKGHTDLNAHTIGIECVNYGGTNGFDPQRNLVLPRRSGDFDPAVWGKPQDWLHTNHPLEPNSKRYWQKFTEQQYEVLDWLTPLLVDTYRLREVVGHEEVATPLGRKTDPGPAFPLAYYKQFADFRNGGSEGTYIAIVDSLNVRGGPGAEYKILFELARGDAFKVLKLEGKWALVQIEGKRGYVHESFIMKS